MTLNGRYALYCVFRSTPQNIAWIYRPILSAAKMLQISCRQQHRLTVDRVIAIMEHRPISLSRSMAASGPITRLRHRPIKPWCRVEFFTISEQIKSPVTNSYIIVKTRLVRRCTRFTRPECGIQNAVSLLHFSQLKTRHWQYNLWGVRMLFV